MIITLLERFVHKFLLEILARQILCMPEIKHVLSNFITTKMNGIRPATQDDGSITISI